MILVLLESLIVFHKSLEPSRSFYFSLSIILEVFSLGTLENMTKPSRKLVILLNTHPQYQPSYAIQIDLITLKMWFLLMLLLAHLLFHL